MSNDHLKNHNRTCGECTACCEGHLHGDAYNMSFFPGRPCYFLGKGKCSIYKNRPENPCVIFKCSWLDDNRSIFPEWMRPDLSGIIIVTRNWGENKEQEYLEVTECGNPIKSEILNWLFNLSINSKIPMKIQVNRGWNFYGSPAFIEEMKQKS